MQQPQKVQIVGFSIHYRKLNHPQFSSKGIRFFIREFLKKTYHGNKRGLVQYDYNFSSNPNYILTTTPPHHQVY